MKRRNERFAQENGIWYRNGEVWRQCVDKASGKVIKEKLIKTNHAQVMYDEKYVNNRKEGQCKYVGENIKIIVIG